ncbi:MAG TPA: CPBP family intramembrane glutamic endopeptidase [Candidatus Dormibacteraeota bacterium]|nr:CPBP family intramembrane glutamic endopeptidase [Candidatus Dormibacteraeota bacterium]
MSLFDDNRFPGPAEPDPEPRPAEPEPWPADPDPRPGEPEPPAPGREPLAPESLAGDPISYAAIGPRAAALGPAAAEAFAPAVSYSSLPALPEDLRISWSWPHLLTFLFFGFASLLVIQIGFVVYLTADLHLSQKQMQKMLEANPKFIVGSNVLWFAVLLLFLYVTLAVLRDLPFWRSLGWKRLSANPAAGKGRPWMYFVAGCGLSIFVAIASSRVKGTDHVPIQELFKSRSGAFLLMAMAVLVAPLVEETVFRGYLYPLFASKFSRFAERSGIDPSQAVRYGTTAGIFLTGVLFGLMHGAQLGWTWGLVSLLILVGVIFTFVRAWTGTVLASFLLHLGYNSMIAVTSIIATKGFTHMPGP